MDEVQKRPIPQKPSEHSIYSDTTVSEYQYAGFWRRLTAYLVDSLIVGIVGITISLMLGTDPFNTEYITPMEQLDVLLTYGMLVAYYILFWVWSDGATPGKKLLGIKIIRTNGEPIGIVHSLLRIFGYMVSGFVFALGYMWIGWDSKKQGWHDKIASTYVVKTGRGNTAAGVVLAVIALLYNMSIFSYAFYRGFTQGLEEVRQDRTSTSSELSLTTPKDLQKAMEPEVKALYDQSQDLFEQMRQTDDVNQVIALNDQNIELLTQATEIDPDNALLWADLGNAYTWRSSNGTLEDMLTAYQKAEELEPNNPVFINHVGDAYLYMDRYEDAILQFQKTFRLTDNSGYANLSVAQAYQELGILDDAKKHYEQAIEIFEKQNDDGSFDDEILEAKKALSELE